jgi:hypothetical protein
VNWDAIGAVGEVAGALGVIVTLLYLSAQIRSSNVASKVEAKLAFQTMYTDFLRMQIDSPELNELFLKGRKQLESLEKQEFYRFTNLALLSFSQFSAGHFLQAQGTLSRSDYHENLAVVRFWLRGEGTRKWWVKYGRYMYGEEFVAFIDSEIAQIQHAPEPGP